MKPVNHSYCEHCGFINWERLEPDLYLCNTSYNGYTVVASISADMAYGEFKYDVNILITDYFSTLYFPASSS